MFGPKVRIVERGRVGLQKKKISRPELVASASTVEFVQAGIDKMGLAGWEAESQETVGIIAKARVKSPSGNAWKVLYGTDNGNMVFTVEQERSPGDVDNEAKQIRMGLEQTLGFL